MHDQLTLDRRGIPGCAVASEAFTQAAEAQMTALGFTADLVWVPHPIQNRTPEQLAEIAEKAIAEILQKIGG
ncbi:hypothetical protein GH722_08905 [Alphaproteobacteria bacterium HT1-32]|nr:hypothetical protein [Alphaproteobacteria bacterium HT1-32]